MNRDELTARSLRHAGQDLAHMMSYLELGLRNAERVELTLSAEVDAGRPELSKIRQQVAAVKKEIRRTIDAAKGVDATPLRDWRPTVAKQYIGCDGAVLGDG